MVLAMLLEQTLADEIVFDTHQSTSAPFRWHTSNLQGYKVQATSEHTPLLHKYT